MKIMMIIKRLITLSLITFAAELINAKLGPISEQCQKEQLKAVRKLKASYIRLQF